MQRILLLLTAAAAFGLTGCVTGATGELPDSDGDTLNDSFELVIGTDPEVADTDGDGWDDGEEYRKFWDPTDDESVPWTGDYPHYPAPEDGIAATGWLEGEISNNWTATDQYGEEISLHDFYGNVVQIELAAEW